MDRQSDLPIMPSLQALLSENAVSIWFVNETLPLLLGTCWTETSFRQDKFKTILPLFFIFTILHRSSEANCEEIFLQGMSVTILNIFARHVSESTKCLFARHQWKYWMSFCKACQWKYWMPFLLPISKLITFSTSETKAKGNKERFLKALLVLHCTHFKCNTFSNRNMQTGKRCEGI